MQNIYTKLSKDKRKKVRSTFIDTKKGRELNPILNRLVIESIVLLICFIVISLYCIISNSFTWYLIVIDVACLIAAIVFFIAQHKIRINQYCIVVNKFNIR